MFLFSTKRTSYAQFFGYAEQPIELEVSFRKQTIEAYANSTFFNALNVKNLGNRTESLTLNLTVPQGWNVIGLSKHEISINPQDSLIIPIRVAIGSKTKGDIGYNIIASVSDSRGNTIKNEYCFIKIPRVSNLSVKFPDRISYFDPISNSSNVSVSINNNGNSEEVVNLFFDGSNTLLVSDNRTSSYSDDITVQPYTDTTLTYRVNLRETKLFNRNMFALRAKISTLDTTQKATLWFNKLETKFINKIPETYKPLVVEVIAQGLIDAERVPIISSMIKGTTLLKNNNDIYYYYRNFSSKQLSDFYNRTKMYAGVNFGSWNFEIGDNARSFKTVSMYGRGGYLSFENGKIISELAANRNLKAGNDNIGGVFEYKLSNKNRVFAGGSYHLNNLLNYNSSIAFVGTSVSINKNHRLYAVGGYNILNRNVDGKNKHNEFGGELYYTSNIGNFRNSIRAKYGSTLYSGLNPGRLNIAANSLWSLSSKHRINFQFYETQYESVTIVENSTASSTNSQNRSINAEYTYIPNVQTQLFGGTSVIDTKFSSTHLGSADNPYASLNYKLTFGARFKSSTGATVISPKIEIAHANTTNNPYSIQYPTSTKRENFNWQYFSLNIRSNEFNILAFYTSGPKSVLDQLYYTVYNRNSRRFQFMPSYNKYLLQDKINLNVGISYNNDIIARSTYTNITSQLYWYLPDYWRIHFFAVYSIQSRKNIQEEIESYQNLYIEAGIKKEFGFQQPRIKYHDVKLTFFKDFNGNMVQEDNEPGIKNIFLNIEKTHSETSSFIPGDFNTLDLLSDNTGQVYIEQIPEGVYKFTYNPLGDEAGTYSKALEENEIHINKSGEYYFPFVEKNKVFGKIILNRSRLSGLGRLDVSNVRVTATDSQGRSYSTLTDKNGEFVLFAPITDEYIVTINNIYYENFDLRQNSFLVQFNGYKQFEVNFVFDEKVRRINFAATDQNMQQGVQQVRRTTISGQIKDANTQQPIRARVNLINTRTNAIVTSVNSSATSGDYTLNFMASDEYLLEVLADDYWYFSENLVLKQVTTFMNIDRDILLKPISVGSSIELNIQFDPNSAYLAPESVAELNRLLRQVKNNPTVRLEIQGHCDDLEAIQSPDIGQERAGAVAKYLIENGFSNVEVKDMKNEKPITTNDTEEGRARNRRIDVVVLRR